MRALPMLEDICGQPRSHRSVVELHEGAEHAAFKASAERIRKAQGRIIVSGMGASLFAAYPAATRLAQQGYSVQTVESSELLHYGTAALRSEDVGVLISRSGASIEVLQLAKKMRAAGMVTVGVMNAPNAELAQLVDLSVQVGAHADQLIAVQTYTGTVLALLLLAEEVCGDEAPRLGAACLHTLPVLSAYLERCLEASNSWKDVFAGPGALYLMGRGAALASVHEGALLLHETAKVPAVAISSGQFRHGPVEVVSGTFRAVVFGSPPHTRRQDRSLVDDLFRMGAKVRWIGPEPDLIQAGEQAESLIPWPELETETSFSTLLAPLFEIVPLQIAAYRLALWRGITPGDFRYASAITSQELGFPLFEGKKHQMREA